MKKLILLFAALPFIACSSNPDKSIEKGVVEFLEKNTGDPSSYEPVETIPIDTLSTQELAKDRINDFQYDINNFEDNLKRLNEEIKLYQSQNRTNYEHLTKGADMYTRGIAHSKKRLEILNSLDDKVEFYLFEHKFRMKNPYGGMELVEVKVVTDTDYNVLSVIRNSALSEARSLFVKKYDVRSFSLTQ